MLKSILNGLKLLQSNYNLLYLAQVQAESTFNDKMLVALQRSYLKP